MRFSTLISRYAEVDANICQVHKRSIQKETRTTRRGEFKVWDHVARCSPLTPLARPSLSLAATVTSPARVAGPAPPTGRRR